MTLIGRIGADARRGAACALVAVVATAIVELVVTVVATPGSIRLGALVRFFALDLSLMGLSYVVLAPLTIAALVAWRLVEAAIDPERARAREPIGAARDPDELQPAAPRAWAWFVAALVYVALSIGATLLFLARFKAHGAIAASLAIVQLVLVAIAATIGKLLATPFARLAARLEPRARRWNPFGRVRVAAAGMAAIVIPTVLVLRQLPVLRDAFPWRIALALAVYVGAVIGFAPLVARRRLLPRRRAVGAAVVAGGVALFAGLATMSLWKWGATDEVKVLTTTPRTPIHALVELVRKANDFDGDGYGTLLGENDCAPFDPKIHPSARDLPDNGIDENCNGKDFSAKTRASWKTGEHPPVPPAFARGDWNFLLVTIDTVRYDHTTMGGYKEAKGRDTTPQLAALARRGVNFTFANAPSAGTMASIPAIVISKFFHSGIALGPERRPQPPKILPDNTTIAEVLKRGGYRTGAILTHEYFNDWGLEQGMDTYDNSLGAKPDPMRITSEEVTTRAQQWIAKQGDDKWFLWCHYIDPHGRYVPHPGEVEYGVTEEDLYDGELAYTDKHLGRLFDWLERSQAGKRTIVIVTSDHGDGFNEHGFINHGMALYKELLHVPLVIYIPEIEPRVVDGPVSPIDILPTVADLAGIDIGDLAVEGETLVPQIFYGKDARDRVVFAETNFPDPQRAAITNDYKLIYNLKANVYQLYDLRSDPWEKKNVWTKDKAGAEKMKALLDEWLDRLYFSRDKANQAQQKRANVLLSGPPSPKNVVDATVADAIQIIGWDTPRDRYVAGQDVRVTVYFKSTRATPTVYRIEAAAVDVGQSAPRPIRQEKNPGDGIFPTSRWRPGEYLKETFTLKVPTGFKAASLRIGVRFLDEKREPATIAGPAATPDGKQAILGDVPIDPAPAPPTPPPSPTKPTPTTPPGVDANPPPPPGKQPLPIKNRALAPR